MSEVHPEGMGGGTTRGIPAEKPWEGIRYSRTMAVRRLGPSVMQVEWEAVTVRNRAPTVVVPAGRVATAKRVGTTGRAVSAASGRMAPKTVTDVGRSLSTVALQ